MKTTSEELIKLHNRYLSDKRLHDLFNLKIATLMGCSYQLSFKDGEYVSQIDSESKARLIELDSAIEKINREDYSELFFLYTK